MRDTAVALTAAGIDNVRFEARLLLGRAAGLSAEQLIARGAEPAPAGVAQRLRELTARRVLREPMAYILGEREFWGLPFKVSPAVLVPRPDSETLIEAALALMPDRQRPWRILDLGLGSGCLLLTLLREYPAASGVGMEVSEEALAVAQANAQALGVAARARLVTGDWRRPDWHRRLGGPFDLAGVQSALYRGRDDRAADAGGLSFRAAAGAGRRRGRASTLITPLPPQRPP